MSIENIIRAWKAEEEDQESLAVVNPIGEELSDQELQEITGGFCSPVFHTCPVTFCLVAPTQA